MTNRKQYATPQASVLNVSVQPFCVDVSNTPTDGEEALSKEHGHLNFWETDSEDDENEDADE